MKALGPKIKAARTAQGLTQAALAAQLGVANTAVSNWETGANKPDVGTLERLCTLLKVSPQYFFGTPGGTADVPDAELAEVLEYYRNKPGMKLLFSITKDATPQDIIQAAEIIEGLKKKNSGQ